MVQSQRVSANPQPEQDIRDRQAVEAKMHQLETSLEQQEWLCFAELQQSLKFELTLNQISNKVRDSLDQHQILQQAVEGLTLALEIDACDALLYDPDSCTITVHYHCSASGQLVRQDHPQHVADAPELCQQCQQQRSCFSFCQIRPIIHCHSNVLVCPIYEGSGDEIRILAALRLFKDRASSFSEMETHLVQQVANQCAIALHQARLYAAAQAEVQKSRRLQQLKDDFLNTIAHELRTPIANMKMAIQIIDTMANHNLGEGLEQFSLRGNRGNEYFTLLQTECDQALELVDNLLYLQQLEAETQDQVLASINFQDWLLELVASFETRIQNRQQTLQVNLAPDLSTLKFDPFCLNRIVTELLSNACKYTPPGETVSISASLVQTDSAPLSTVLELIVTNTGVEIPADALSQVFDRFYRVPNGDRWKQGGTGLGLALVKKLVEQMQGNILATSGNQQTEFTVLLPVVLEGVG